VETALRQDTVALGYLKARGIATTPLADRLHADALSANIRSPASHWFAGLFRLLGGHLLTTLTCPPLLFTNFSSTLTPNY
jgi:hypothetical protein